MPLPACHIDFATNRVLVVPARGAPEWFVFPNFVTERSDAIEVGLVIRELRHRDSLSGGGGRFRVRFSDSVRAFLHITTLFLLVRCTGGLVPQPGCTLENCRAMVQACSISIGGPAASCWAVGPTPAGYDYDRLCVNACNAGRDGVLVQCIAGKAMECRAARDGGQDVTQVIEPCLTADAGAPPEVSCADRCNAQRTACDDLCSGGRACDLCNRNGMRGCPASCPDSGFAVCMDCSERCSFTAISCRDACPR